MLFYVVLVAGCVVVVLSENRNPIRSLAWVIALVALPVAGVIFYFFFGRSLKGHRMISRHSKRKLMHHFRNLSVPLDQLDLSDGERQLASDSQQRDRDLYRRQPEIRNVACGSFVGTLHDIPSILYLQRR